MLVIFFKAKVILIFKPKVWFKSNFRPKRKGSKYCLANTRPKNIQKCNKVCNINQYF